MNDLEQRLFEDAIRQTLNMEPQHLFTTPTIIYWVGATISSIEQRFRQLGAFSGVCDWMVGFEAGKIQIATGTEDALGLLTRLREQGQIFIGKIGGFDPSELVAAVPTNDQIIAWLAAFQEDCGDGAAASAADMIHRYMHSLETKRRIADKKKG